MRKGVVDVDLFLSCDTIINKFDIAEGLCERYNIPGKTPEEKYRKFLSFKKKDQNEIYSNLEPLFPFAYINVINIYALVLIKEKERFETDENKITLSCKLRLFPPKDELSELLKIKDEREFLEALEFKTIENFWEFFIDIVNEYETNINIVTLNGKKSIFPLLKMKTLGFDYLSDKARKGYSYFVDSSDTFERIRPNYFYRFSKYNNDLLESIFGSLDNAINLLLDKNLLKFLQKRDYTPEELKKINFYLSKENILELIKKKNIENTLLRRDKNGNFIIYHPQMINRHFTYLFMLMNFYYKYLFFSNVVPYIEYVNIQNTVLKLLERILGFKKEENLEKVKKDKTEEKQQQEDKKTEEDTKKKEIIEEDKSFSSDNGQPKKESIDKTDLETEKEIDNKQEDSLDDEELTEVEKEFEEAFKEFEKKEEEKEIKEKQIGIFDL